MREVGVEEDDAAGPQGGVFRLVLLARQESRAAFLERRHQLFRLALGASVLGIEVDEPALLAIDPGQEAGRLGVEGVEQPHLADLVGQAPVIQNRCDHLETAAVAGEQDLPDRKVFLLQGRFPPQRVGHVRHEPLEAVGVFQLAAEGILRVPRSLGNDEHGVAVARHKLFDEPVMVQHSFDVGRPAVEVDDEIDLARFAEAFGDEDGHAAVGIVLFGGKELVLVAVAVGAVGVGKRRGRQLGKNQLALGGVALRKTSAAGGGSGEDEKRQQE